MANKFQKGAASFYIVIITSLLFGVIVVGFMSLVTREIKKSQENSLYQASYDSALAGVEDAKLALNQYYRCVTDNGVSPDCPRIINHIENDTDCDVVSRVLIGDEAGGEVKIVETSVSGDTTEQAYTCVMLDTTPSDYRATLSSADSSIKVVPLQTVNDESGEAKQVKSVRVSWYAGDEGSSFYWNNSDGGQVEFNKLSDNPGGEPATPPTLAVQLYQTGDTFDLTQFNEASGDRTNRGTVWLVPGQTGTNSLDASVLVNSNVHDSSITTHEGQIVKCEGGRAFACEVTIALPDPIGGDRDYKNGTFMLALSLPYNAPTTDFKVEMLDNAGSVIEFYNTQVAVDSTGRANDIFSRVDSRIEFNDVYFPYPEYALDLGLGTDGDQAALKKNFRVTQNCWSTNSEGGVAECSDRSDRGED